MTLLGYLLVKWTSNSYILKSSHKTGRDVIKVGDFLCDTVYFVPASNIRQKYTSNGGKQIENNYQIEYFYFN